MLYIDMKVNGHPVKAFVDSGAQATIMSPDCAEKCGIMRLLDERFAGIAKGVGTAKILGRVHSTQIQLATDLYLPCSFTVMEGRGVDLLFGLDMLKRYQACIDLKKNALIIHDREIPFLAEHEIPKQIFNVEDNSEQQVPSHPAIDSNATTTGPSTELRTRDDTQTPQPQNNNHVETWSQEKIQQLKNLGMDQNEAIKLLNVCQGNIDAAANLYFSMT